MSEKKKRVRGGALFAALAAAMLLLAALPATLAQFTSLDWGGGTQIESATFDMTVELAADPNNTQKVTLDTGELLNTYGEEALNAVLANGGVTEGEIRYDTTLVTLTVTPDSTATGYFAVHYDGQWYYSTSVRAGDHVSFTLPGTAVYEYDAADAERAALRGDGFSLTVEAHWGQPPVGHELTQLQPVLDAAPNPQKTAREDEKRQELQQNLAAALEAYRQTMTAAPSDQPQDAPAQDAADAPAETPPQTDPNGAAGDTQQTDASSGQPSE